MVDTAAGLPGRKSVLYVSDGLSLKPGEAISYEIEIDAVIRRTPAANAAD